MTAHDDVSRNRATAAEVAALLIACDQDFSPPLSERQDIADYATRICDRAERFEYWALGALAGLVAIYCVTPPGRPAFITNVSVLAEYRSRGIAATLLKASITHAKSCGFDRIALEVDAHAHAARRLYAMHGFCPAPVKGSADLFELKL
ncbi:GNAT family N-acetyltransferase [Tateyamaria sp. syn59]|uniref:GNAT family N-acetyltransferase n=1 Tax=Tateyamaria sp. syn59 TaxID=2576942 RepID=UPI0011BF8082|nr:GNAT family N-acetyltransferase [Tateyamaria sp. syn59]